MEVLESISWRRRWWFGFKYSRARVSPPDTAWVQNTLSAFLLMNTFLYLDLRKWIYRVWETVKLLQCKSFCLWEGKVDQEGLRNQRIKAYMVKYNCTICFNCTYHFNIHMHQLIDFHICKLSAPQSMKWPKKLDFFSHWILIIIFTPWVFQIVIRKQ